MSTVIAVPAYAGPSQPADAMRSANPPPGPGSSGEVTCEQVVQATIELIDRDGLRFTVGRIGEQLANRSTALSRLFPDQQALLDAVVEALIDELFADPQLRPSTPHWHEYLHRVAHAFRRVALAHPHAFPLIATRPAGATWLQPPLRSLRWTETFLDTLQRCQFSDHAAAATYNAFTSFLLGHLLLEVAALGAEVILVAQPAPGPPRPSDLADYPRLAGMQQHLVTNDAREEFEEALEALLDRLDNKGVR